MEFPFGYNYCFDTSALIWMKNIYIPKTFVTLWAKFGELVDKGIVISPREVLDEIAAKDDELHKWAKSKKLMFYELDPEQIALAQDIVRSFPSLIDGNKTIPEADPFVIALARKKGALVVTQETLVFPVVKKVKIPNVCNHHGVEYIDTTEFIRRQHWEI